LSALEPLWVQIAALLPTQHTQPLGCHRPHIPARIVFDKLSQLLCPAAATATSRRPGWAAATPP
jgi:hypothetical protein